MLIHEHLTFTRVKLVGSSDFHENIVVKQRIMEGEQIQSLTVFNS